jgi:hypothetical protein
MTETGFFSNLLAGPGRPGGSNTYFPGCKERTGTSSQTDSRR